MTRRHSIKDLVCVNCGISFQTSHKRRYCCVACRNASKSGHTRRHICQHCANEFEGRKRKYCSSGCEAKAKRKRENKTGRARRYPTPIIDGQRECLDCGEVKSLESFRECANAGSGYASTCKDCFRGYAAIRASKRTKDQRRAERERAVAKQGRTLFKRRSLPPTQRQIDVLIKRNAIDAWRYWINQKAPDWWIDAYWKATGKPWSKPGLNRSESYRIRYDADLEFRIKECGRHRSKKIRRKEAKIVVDDLTVKASIINEFSRCLYCNIKITDKNRTIDHMDPLHLGGQHSASNVVICCLSCNSRKGARPFYEWVAQLPEKNSAKAMRVYERKRGGVSFMQVGFSFNFN